MRNGTELIRHAYCITSDEHFKDAPIQRWLYCINPTKENREAAKLKIVDYGVKHFKVHDSSDREWIEKTKSGPAQFLPSFGPDSEIVQQTVCNALSCAMRSGFFESNDLNGFVFDAGFVVGAAAGKITSRIEFYMTNQGDFHLRPKE